MAKVSARANARELAVHLIYSWEFTEEEPQDVVDARLSKEYYSKLSGENEVYAELPNNVQRAYIDTVVSGVANRVDDLNAEIQKYAIGWDVRRISRLARAIMQLAIYEILYVEDVPTGVAISEAVRLAKKYDGEETGSFVNGILGAFGRAQNQPAVQEPAACEEPAEDVPAADEPAEEAPAAEEDAQ